MVLLRENGSCFMVFNDEEDLKKELFKIEKRKMHLLSKSNKKSQKKVDVTPEEVRLYHTRG